MIKLAILVWLSCLLAHVPLKARSGDVENTTLVFPPWDHCYGLHRVTQRHLSLYSGYRRRFKSPQGIAAVKLVFNNKPGRGDDDELTVYGVNSGEGQIIYNKSLVSLGFFGKKGNGEAEFSSPHGIAANREGLVVVADTGNDRIVFLKNEGNELRYVSSTILENPPLKSPTGICMEGEYIYVADSGNNRIVVIDQEGRLIKEIPSLDKPFGIAVIAGPNWNYYRSTFIAVTDSSNQRLSIFSLHGKLKARIRYKEISDKRGGFFYPAIDYYSNVYVTDTISGCVYKFDKSLRFLTSIACAENSEEKLDQPRGITIYRRFGQVFIAERAGASYFWVGTDIKYSSCRAEMRDDDALIRVRFLLTEHSYVSLDLENENGKLIKSLGRDMFTEPGLVTKTYHVARNLLLFEHAKCKDVLILTAKPTYSSKKYLTVRRKIPVRFR